MFEFFVKRKDDASVEPTAECLSIPAIRKIWDRDTMRSKKKARNDLSLVYFGGYYNSPYKGYGDDGKWEKLGEQFKGDKEWRPWKDDKVINKALEVYKELQLASSHSMSLLITLRETLLVSEQTIKDIQSEVRKKSDKDDEGTKDLKKSLEYIEKLIDLGEKLPKTLKRITEMEENVEKELHESKTRGGGAILESEMPDDN